MIKSMTGYGQSTGLHGGCAVQVQVRAVNNRFADVRIRVPGEWLSIESELRRRVQSTVRRGRVDVTIKLEAAPGEPVPLKLQPERARAWLRALADLRRIEGVEGAFDGVTLLRLPGVVQESTEEEDQEGLREAIETTLDGALERFDADRRREGETLAEDLVARFAAMRGYVDRMSEAAADAPDELKQRLEERLAKLGPDVALDPARVAQEALLLADRADVTEELVRLRSHLDRADAILRARDDDPVGKRLDFLLQEIHRETNTIGSKSQRLPLSDVMLEMKSENEKIREQVQNLE
ncbi:MAG: YicC family protein [Planctomycetota bacterium]|nr:YicC family protein [Planctomycetota bacterium]